MSANCQTLAAVTGMSDQDVADEIRYFDLLAMAKIAWLYGDNDTAGDKLEDKARRLAHRCADRGFYSPLLDLLDRAYA